MPHCRLSVLHAEGTGPFNNVKTTSNHFKKTRKEVHATRLPSLGLNKNADLIADWIVRGSGRHFEKRDRNRVPVTEVRGEVASISPRLWKGREGNVIHEAGARRVGRGSLWAAGLTIARATWSNEGRWVTGPTHMAFHCLMGQLPAGPTI